MAYLRRTIDGELDELLTLAPALALDGPKGVGKTDTAARRAGTVWLLDDPGQREVARADFGLSGLPSGTVLFDEWQKVPQLWTLCDARLTPASKQVGSCSPGLRRLRAAQALTAGQGASCHCACGRWDCMSVASLKPGYLFLTCWPVPVRRCEGRLISHCSITLKR